MTDLDKPIVFLATANAEQSRDFYVEFLGLKLEVDESFALVFDVGGTMLRIQKVDSFTPARQTVFGWSVEDIERSVKELSERGIAFEHYDHVDQDECGIWASPSGARVAWFRDPSGNVPSLTQHP